MESQDDIPDYLFKSVSLKKIKSVQVQSSTKGKPMMLFPSKSLKVLEKKR